MKELKGDYAWDWCGEHEIMFYPPIYGDLSCRMWKWVRDKEKVDVELKNKNTVDPYVRKDGYIKIHGATIKCWGNNFILSGQILQCGRDQFLNGIEGWS